MTGLFPPVVRSCFHTWAAGSLPSVSVFGDRLPPTRHDFPQSADSRYPGDALLPPLAQGTCRSSPTDKETGLFRGVFIFVDKVTSPKGWNSQNSDPKVIRQIISCRKLIKNLKEYLLSSALLASCCPSAAWSSICPATLHESSVACASSHRYNRSWSSQTSVLVTFFFLIQI